MKMLSTVILLVISTGAASVRASVQAVNKSNDAIPTIGFCEMVKNARLYFDKPVRVVAKYEMATEGRYLSDNNSEP